MALAIYEEILCKSTGLQGHLPSEPSPAVEKEEVKLDEPPQDVLLVIQNSTLRGKPELIISGGQYAGVRVTELAAKEEAGEKEAASGPSIYDNLSGFFSKANAPIGPGKYEADVAPRMSVEEANARSRSEELKQVVAPRVTPVEISE
eukprot:GHVN01074492.1.p1 GENE.GHVN01074492.1~~GHVN01074492.1.p1  ORF type:complete len:147 (-),score=17.62 GHVN01074492.1:67-507(-)